LTSYCKSLFVVSGLSLLAACGNNADEASSGAVTAPQLTAATLGSQEILTVSEYLALEPFSSADRKNGERQAQICKACHSTVEGGPNMIGPALFGFFGKAAASHDGFDYSDALLDADFVWTPRALDAWLAQPGRFLPGNRMTFAGVLKQRDRDDLIAYLLEETSRSETVQP
jgi:cytochrome c